MPYSVAEEEAVMEAMLRPIKVSASEEEEVRLMLSPALMSPVSESSDWVKSICRPSNEEEPLVEARMFTLSVGVVVPIPTRSVVVVT